MRFEFATATRIVFGEGTAATLPELVRSFGVRPLVVTGSSPERAAWLVSALSAESLVVPGEPTVDLVRDGAEARERAIARICGLGRELDGPAFDACTSDAIARAAAVAATGNAHNPNAIPTAFSVDPAASGGLWLEHERVLRDRIGNLRGTEPI